jgi:alkylated DNA repair dioxygenase AlkB
MIDCIKQLPLAPFQFGQFEGKRRVLSFGRHFNFSTQTLERAGAFPAWIVPTIRALENAEGFVEGAIGHVLFTEYEPGTGIGWHRDKKQFDKIFGLSLGAPCDFRFRRKAGARWDRFVLRAEPRSLYTLAAESRSDWEHSIAPMQAVRFSVTFRTMTDAACT